MPSATAKQLLNAMTGWSRRAKQVLIAATDACILPFSIWAAFALRVGHPWPEGINALWWLFLAVIGIGIPILWARGLYHEVTRHTGPRFVVQATQGVGLTALSVAALLYLSGDWAPRSLPIIFFLVALGLVTAARSVARHLLRTAAAGVRSPVIVWGSGEPGARLVASLVSSPTYRPVALVDDGLARRGSRIRGVPARPTADLERLVAAHGVTHVFLAIPEASREVRRTILERVTSLPVIVRSVPSIEEVLAGKAAWDETREVPIEDLLGREPVPPDRALLERCVRSKRVLVTGAGGSIGAELCRQVVALEPLTLVLFERSEHALYLVEQELRAIAGNTIEIVALLGSVLDRERLERALRAFSIDTVYHAAAYKHVPMVERNVAEGLENNALGTLVAAESALATGVTTFVLISTDKAVRPTSVMGASKRFAELCLQALAAEHRGATVFSMVRFGNVLGSSGSVVPLFRDQIARGGPVTVTHPDVIRYFMTIPEAAQLVMQAGAMASGGEVFLLDMGEPVRIADLAERMIRLAGRSVRHHEGSERTGTPVDQGSIEIVFTGLRPGEKLFEELLIAADAVTTGHARVKMARERLLPWNRIAPMLDQASEACRRNDVPALLALLAAAVPEYRPSPGHHDLLWDEEELERRAILGQPS